MKKNYYFILLLLLFLSLIYACSTVPSRQVITLTKDPAFQESINTVETPSQETERNQPAAAKTINQNSSNNDLNYEQKLAELKRIYNSKGYTAPPVATVMNFNSQGLSEMDAQFISDYLSSALYNTKSFRIIDRNQRETLLKELEFSMTGCSEESCQLEAGRLLSADKIIVGNLGQISSRFIMDIRMIDVSSGETVSVSNNIYNDMDQLVDDCRFIAINLTKEFLLNN